MSQSLTSINLKWKKSFRNYSKTCVAIFHGKRVATIWRIHTYWEIQMAQRIHGFSIPKRPQSKEIGFCKVGVQSTTTQTCRLEMEKSWGLWLKEEKEKCESCLHILGSFGFCGVQQSWLGAWCSLILALSWAKKSFQSTHNNKGSPLNWSKLV